jgi:hypothetical protein
MADLLKWKRYAHETHRAEGLGAAGHSAEHSLCLNYHTSASLHASGDSTKLAKQIGRLLRCLLRSHQPIPNTSFGDDMHRLCGIALELLSQMPHIDPQIMLVFGLHRSPDLA